MIKQAQIEAENAEPLTDVQVLGLSVLVRSYEGYRKNIGIYPDFEGELAREVANPTVKTRGLKAVLTAQSKQINLVAETEGTDKAPSYFSTKKNWDELALDALNVVYNLPAGYATKNFGVVRVRICDLVIPGETPPVRLIVD